MTWPKDGNPQRLPPEVEFQAKREELLNGLRSLEKSGEVNPYNFNVLSTSSVYFLEGGEVFQLSFSRYQSKDKPGTIKSERLVGISPLKTVESVIYGTILDGKTKRSSVAPIRDVVPYYPPADFTVIKEDIDGNLSGSDARPVKTIRGLDNLISVVSFINTNIPLKSGRECPVTDIPDALRDLVNRIRESKRMKFEYKLPEFYDVLGRVRDKTTKVEDIDKSKYKKGESIVLATTGWVRVEKDGEEFELKFDKVDVYSNSDYSEQDEIYRRQIGDEEEEKRYLFSSTDVNPLSFINPIRTEGKLQECIDMLKLLDEAIPDTTSISS